MKRPGLLAGVATVLAAVLALLFVYPEQMIAPGALKPAHADLEHDCFACHAPLRGASSARCITCHVPAWIGIKTTKGAPVHSPAKMPAFHAELREPDCMACHTDHAAILLARGKSGMFDHRLLKPGIADKCASCHAKPDDGLHAAIIGGCTQCHTTNGWKPASFAHDHYFRLDSNHNVACATCHKENQFKSYTCYGCHEHQPAKIIAENAEEGIRNIENCVRCHRSASGEGGEGGEGGEHGERRGERRDDE